MKVQSCSDYACFALVATLATLETYLVIMINSFFIYCFIVITKYVLSIGEITYLVSSKIFAMVVNLFDLKEWSSVDNGLVLINKLIEFQVLPVPRKCPRGHDMKMVKDSNVFDNFKWICRDKIREKKQTAKHCNYR
jgi:hypothetical protein